MAISLSDSELLAGGLFEVLPDGIRAGWLSVEKATRPRVIHRLARLRG